MRESTIEKYLCTEVVKAGGCTYKFVSPGRVNVPDRIVIWPAGRRFTAAGIAFVELKAPGEKPRPGQAREIRRLLDLGCSVAVLDSKELVDLFVKNWRTA